MSNIHHSCECLVLRRPPRTPARWPAVLNVIAVILEAFQEALEMRRAAHRRYPFREE
jgi:hypothetical protein